ncbi:MAG: hypothetical protein H6908_05625 [Hyphomicrobiales bacterium]|nr:hypothetical protein [Rickettsiales bacterium]MCP5362093.1 hypothetical protein [Hyphomicrobiales bacterium]
MTNIVSFPTAVSYHEPVTQNAAEPQNARAFSPQTIPDDIQKLSENLPPKASVAVRYQYVKGKDGTLQLQDTVITQSHTLETTNSGKTTRSPSPEPLLALTPDQEAAIFELEPGTETPVSSCSGAGACNAFQQTTAIVSNYMKTDGDILNLTS